MATTPGPAPKAAPKGVDADPLADVRRGGALGDALLRIISNGVCVARADGTIEYADDKFRSIFGFAPNELEDKPLSALDGVGLFPALVDLTEPDRAPSSKDVECVRKDGKKILCAWSGARLGSGDGMRHLLVVEDVTGRRRSEALEHESEQRLKEIQRLRELDQVKTQFINNAAHELKTPLTPVKVQTHLLRTVLAEGLTPDQKQSVDILHRNLERLRHLVDDVLEAARIQANKLQMTRAPLDLNPLVLETVESFKAVAAQVGITIEWRYCERPHVEGDWQRLTQVVYNLLSNAVKFTPPGGKVTVETSKSHNEAFIRVKDTGHGLSSVQISHLFQPFSQVHDLMQDTRAGTGLGLFISQGIIQEHGGRIWAESPGPGRGSAFTVALPLTHLEVAPLAEPRHAPEAISLRPPKGLKANDALARRLRELI